MVEFCAMCGGSIPYRDIDVKDGKEFTAPDYPCPTCGRPAAGDEGAPLLDAEPDEDRDVVIEEGTERVESA